MKILISMVFFLMAAGLPAAQAPQLKTRGNVVVLKNEKVRLEVDVSAGRYSLFKHGEARPAISQAKMGINGWFTDAAGTVGSWKEREATDSSGKALALDLSFKSKAAPELLFSFVLHGGQDFLSASGGIHNTGSEPVRIKDIHVMADGIVYEGADLARDFAMIDGFSGGEPLEYGRRFYSPLTRGNALKSRNNILLTFTGETRRHSLVMGGLTYQDFEKFATIAQDRRTELALGKDGKKSLLCYLDLPKDKSDRSMAGETLELTKGSQIRIWQNHEFRCSETATSVKEPGSIVIAVGHLHPDRPYMLGFSWWQGLWHGEHPDLSQSVFVEFDKDGVSKRLPLVENRTLPRFDGVKKQDVEQVELVLPDEAIRAGKASIIVEKAAGLDDADPNVYLSEIWLRDGRSEPLLASTLTPVADGPQTRRLFKAQLFAADPVGKRVDPGQSYLASDEFYIDVTGSDPFLALESYALRVRKAQRIDLSMYDFPTVCLWYASDKRYGGRGAADNTTLGAVNEMKAIKDSGFLNYSRAAVRLVPDSYMPDNQQGWWDDEHWRREDTDRDTTQNGRYVKPYETTVKWGKAVTDLGGIPLTYFQTAYRSEDYAAKFPGHMLFNKQYAWKGEPVDTQGKIFTTWEEAWNRNGKIVWGYDFTDPDFVAHMKNVYANLKNGGIRGLMFDYPESGWASAGGMEGDDSTTAAAYRKIYQLAYDGLGPGAYIHERNMLSGSDVTLGMVASMRTENDTDTMDGATVTRCGMRWYKNRVVVNQDADSKNIVRVQGNRDQVRAILTMCYITTGRLLLANSFTEFSPETFRDLTRTFPYHTAPKSARPVDAFVSDSPSVFDFEVNPEWHQVTFYNSDPKQPKTVGINLSGPQVDGALGLKPGKQYYLFDFWNDRFLGRQAGDSRMEHQLRPGEARMISVRECLDRPQILSTDRHVMQGYLDLLRVDWDEKRRILSGVSKIVGGDPYTVTLALNGHIPRTIECSDKGIAAALASAKDGIASFTLKGTENGTAEWSVYFEAE
jgi:hypothetical protein